MFVVGWFCGLLPFLCDCRFCVLLALMVLFVRYFCGLEGFSCTVRFDVWFCVDLEMLGGLFVLVWFRVFYCYDGWAGR